MSKDKKDNAPEYRAGSVHENGLAPSVTNTRLPGHKLDKDEKSVLGSRTASLLNVFAWTFDFKLLF